MSEQDDSWLSENAEWLFIPYSGERRKRKSYGLLIALLFSAAVWGVLYLGLRAWWMQ